MDEARSSRHWTRTTLVVLLLGACGTVVATRALGSHGKAGARPGAEASAEEGAGQVDVAEELAAMRRRLARMEQAEQAHGLEAGKALGADAADAARVAAQKRLEEKVKKYYTPELEAKRFASYFGTLDEARRAEGLDLPWAQRVQSLVQTGLRGGTAALATLSVPTVECGRTLCRMEIKSSNVVLRGGALGELLQNVGAELPQASVYVPQDGGPMIGYFARTGVDLPPMDSVEQLVADLP